MVLKLPSKWTQKHFSCSYLHFHLFRRSFEMAKNCMEITESTFLGQNKPIFWLVGGRSPPPPPPLHTH